MICQFWILSLNILLIFTYRLCNDLYMCFKCSNGFSINPLVTYQLTTNGPQSAISAESAAHTGCIGNIKVLLLFNAHGNRRIKMFLTVTHDLHNRTVLRIKQFSFSLPVCFSLSVCSVAIGESD